VDKKQIEVDGEEKWLYAAVDTDSKLLLEIDVFSRRGTDSAAAFLHRLTEKHDVPETEFLVDAGGFLTALFRHELSGQLNYTERSRIEKWFQAVSMRIDRFHSFWRGSQGSARRWLRRFILSDTSNATVRWLSRSFCDVSSPTGGTLVHELVSDSIRHHYNHDRPNQALDGRTPVEEVLN